MEPVKRVAIATYTDLDGQPFEVEYDPDAPCWMCGEPVGSASMGGTVICPSCDCGYNRDGTLWTMEDNARAHERYRENVTRVEREQAAELARQAETAVRPGLRTRASDLAERRL